MTQKTKMRTKKNFCPTSKVTWQHLLVGLCIA
jgi:hypothetical protein